MLEDPADSGSESSRRRSPGGFGPFDLHMTVAPEPNEHLPHRLIARRHRIPHPLVVFSRSIAPLTFSSSSEAGIRAFRSERSRRASGFLFTPCTDCLR